MRIYTQESGGNYSLDINDIEGILYGFCDNEGILGLDCKFTGAAGVIANSEKLAKISFFDDLYTETRNLSVAVYSDSKTVAALFPFLLFIYIVCILISRCDSLLIYAYRIRRVFITLQIYERSRVVRNVFVFA